MSNSETPISMNEHLSALLDDEAGSFEERRVLDELSSDRDLSKKLANYSLIGETMRSGEAQKSSVILGSSFLAGIHEKIDQEDSFDEVLLNSSTNTNSTTLHKQKNDSSWFSKLRPVGGFAVAASVGALAFMTLQNYGFMSSPTSPTNNIVDSSAPTAIVQQSPVTNQSIEITSPDLSIGSVAVDNLDDRLDDYADGDAEARSLLKRYVDTHMQYASTSAFVPAVRVIAFTDGK